MSNANKPSEKKWSREEERKEMLAMQHAEEEYRLERLKLLRHIKTARGVDAINAAVDQGYTPLIYEVKTSEKMYVKEALIKDLETGKVETMHFSHCMKISGGLDEEEIVMEVSYDPYKFPPYAAYLLPDDMQKGETVILEDLIEDIVGAIHNGYVLRRQDSAEAVWDGEKFIIDRDSYDVEVTMG